MIQITAWGAVIRGYRPWPPRHATCDSVCNDPLVESKLGNMASLEEVIGQFRRMLPEESATARAIDRQEPWERIALNAVNDGYIEFANEFASFIEVCLRRNS